MRRKAATGALLCALILSLIMLSGCGDGNISATVSVLGNDLTDMDREALGRAISDITEQNPIIDDIPIKFLGKEYTLELKDIDAEYDAEAIADRAYEAGSQNLWDKMFGSDDAIEVPLSIKYDEAALERISADAAAALSREATDFTYEIGEDSVTVTKGGGAVSLSSGELLDALTARLDDMDYTALEMESDAKLADIDIDALKAELDRPAKNPSLDLEKDPTGQTILEGQRGITVDAEVARKALEDSGDEATFSFPVQFTEPTMSMQTFKSNLFRDTLSTVTSSFNANLKGRTTNVKLACDFCNGVILNPGDEFSYNGTVGPRTYERGFKDATVYVAGTTEEGVGGGICQVSSTIYSAALHADLQISERYNHSYMITYVPLGEDATVVYGSKDFKFINNTDYPIQLRVTYGKSTMTVSIIGTNLTNKTVEISTKRLSSTPFKVVYQTDTSLPVNTTKVKNNGYTGYVTESYRIVYENGKQISSTFENKSVYKKLDKLILENPATPEQSGNYVPPASGPATVPEPTTPTDPTAPTEPATSPAETQTPDPVEPEPTDIPDPVEVNEGDVPVETQNP